MSIDLKVPAIGESVAEIYVGKWYKAEGDSISPDEALVELESDKATLDVRAPAGGVLAKILKQTGEVAEVGEVIAHLESDGAAAKPSPAVQSEARQSAPEEKSAPADEPPHTAARAPQARREAQPPQETPEPAAEAAQEQVSERPPAKAPAVKPAPAGPAAPAETARPGEIEPAPATNRGESRSPLSLVRRRIAERLVEAQQTAALLTTFNEVDMTAVKELRGEFGEEFLKRHGVKLGFMSFFVKAAVDALKECPEINAIIDGGDILYRDYYDIGVAIGSERGLVVPVLRNAEGLTFAGIEKAIEDLAARAHAGDLRVDELQGGTFTITNGGVYGSLLSTPIVNPPQSGVLGMHAIQPRPTVVDNQVVIRPMMYLALTYDHRIVDGREAVTFLRRIKESIEAPARMLLET
jgi:2-oxoglutarate dehydrogenase E2 component (dihydrolipoamide succinyltransferase)